MEQVLVDYGVWALALIFLIDDLGIPFPSGTSLFAGAVFARTHLEISPWPLLIIAIVMSQTGNAILFFWGRRGGREWLKKHGHRVLLPRKRLVRLENFFAHRHGIRTIFLASLVNTIRPSVALLAGSSNMHPRKFFPINFLGITVWSTAIVGSGYFFGDQIWTIVKEDWKILPALIIVYLVGRYFWSFLKAIFYRRPKDGFFKF